MKIHNLKIAEIKPLLPLPAVNEALPLYKSIKSCGLMQPLVVNGVNLCDGHKRLAVLKSINADECLCVETSLSPTYAFVRANDRELSAVELAALYAREPNAQAAKALLEVKGVSVSPQMAAALSYIAKNIIDNVKLSPYSMSLSVWRELGHLGGKIGDFAPDLLLLNASAAEKRNIAALLRQAARKNSLPERLPGKNGQDVIKQLHKLSEPRRTTVLAKYEAAVKQSNLPSAAKLKIDPTFSKPGIQAIIDIQRTDLELLDALKSSLKEIFKTVPEL